MYSSLVGSPTRAVSAALRLACVAAGLTAGAALAHADIIAVANQGFETLPAGGLTDTAGCPAGCSYSTNVAIPNWTATATGSFSFGQLQPGTPPNTIFNSIPSGDAPTVAYINGTGEFSQTLATDIVAGLTYTLQVDVGTPLSFPEVSNTIELLAGSTLISPVIASGSASPAVGGWATATATYVSPLGDPNAGKPLTIVLSASNGVINSQTDFDNVRLSDNAVTSSPVPEPASWVLLVGAILATLVFGRNRLAAARD